MVARIAIASTIKVFLKRIAKPYVFLYKVFKLIVVIQRGVMSKERKKIVSDNSIMSDNNLEIKNSLVNFDFKGLENVLTMFFPSMREAVVERYRAQTIALVGIEAVRLANEKNIKAKPMPPKMALPYVEKMSLEHESEMYDMWARLLVASSNNYHPLQQQYIDVLANINSEQAVLLKNAYKAQKTRLNPENLEADYEENQYVQRYEEIYESIQRRSRSFVNGEMLSILPDAFGVFTTYFEFPYVVEGDEKVRHPYVGRKPVGEGKIMEAEYYELMEVSERQKNMLLGLKKLGLIQYDDIARQSVRDGDKIYRVVLRCGVFLTDFGFNFVKCLENME